jgi:hypothetical protein
MKDAMETVHLKTVDPLSQNLLKSASQRGIKLNWDRYEKLQPQDGFLRVGLSCPYGCMQGPCRIDPFGRGPDRGLCGLDRDRMVAALLLRLVLNGTLEDMNAKGSAASPALEKLFSSSAKKLGGEKLLLDEVSRAVCSLSRPAESAEALVLQALRLGIKSLGLPEKKKTAKRAPSVKVGHGLLAQQGLLIGVCGNPPAALLEEARKEASRIRGGAQFVALGDWVASGNGFVPIACTSGEAELVLSSGKVRLLISGPGTDPSIVELCQTLGIPLLSSQDAGKAAKAMQQAAPKAKAASGPADAFPIEESAVIVAPDQWEDAKAAKRVAIIGGADYVQQSLGWIPTEVGPALQAEGHAVAAWGDAALWMMKKGLTSANHKLPVRVIDNEQGPMLALQALADSGTLKQLKGICFVGLKGCRDLAMAVGLAAAGFKVCVATPLPLWGSEKVRDLLAKKLAMVGGSLAHFDHPAQAGEIVDWFTK